MGASIPGFSGDMGLPSPDFCFLIGGMIRVSRPGQGRWFRGVWLGDAARGQGAPVPLQIADQLRLQEFRNFHAFRRAFWKAVAADSELNTQFIAIDLDLMRKGKAPLALPKYRYGGRIKFEIHYQFEVAQGGAVYDMDNLVVMTPKRHILFHGKGTEQK
ncbi:MULTISPECIES: hypothetical protein [unclassified Pseudomonas]|jgi:hypothetical protein|uniref:hypothetical protein n=1 Tax=Pseudomonas sp. A-R-26 TaxID=2832404 RepID=UPI001CBF06EF|nr:hypothetical protein [Pseudomonas sp. A-R-26]